MPRFDRFFRAIKDVLWIQSHIPELEAKVAPFQNALTANAQYQLQEQIASATNTERDYSEDRGVDAENGMTPVLDKAIADVNDGVIFTGITEQGGT